MTGSVKTIIMKPLHSLDTVDVRDGLCLIVNGENIIVHYSYSCSDHVSDIFFAVTFFC